MFKSISLRTSGSGRYSASNFHSSNTNAALSIQHDQDGLRTTTRIDGKLSGANWHIDGSTLTNSDALQLVATHSMAEPMPENVYFSIGKSTLNISVPPLPKIKARDGEVKLIIDCDPKSKETKVTVSYTDEAGQKRNSSVANKKLADNELIDKPMGQTATIQFEPTPVVRSDLGSLFAKINAPGSPEDTRKSAAEIVEKEPQLKHAINCILAQNLSVAQPGKGAPRTPSSTSMAELAAASGLTLAQQKAVYDYHERSSPPQDAMVFLQDFLFPRTAPGYQRVVRHEPTKPFREDGTIHENFAWVVTESYVLNGDESKAIVQTVLCPKDPHLPHELPALNVPNKLDSIIGRLFAGSYVSQTTIRYSEKGNQRQIAEFEHTTGRFIQNQTLDGHQQMVVLQMPDFRYQYSAVANTNNEHRISKSIESTD